MWQMVLIGTAGPYKLLLVFLLGDIRKFTLLLFLYGVNHTATLNESKRVIDYNISKVVVSYDFDQRLTSTTLYLVNS
jgi:hypothetical protein